MRLNRVLPNGWGKYKLAVTGGILIGILLVTFLAPLLRLEDPLSMDSTNQMSAPNEGHLLGTDPFGRDILSRLFWGGRRTLSVASVAVLITTSLGMLFGLVSGYFGGVLDQGIMRLMDVLLAFPGILLMLSFIAMLGPGSRTLAIAVGLSGIPVFSRVVRSGVLAIRGELYIAAAKAIGCTDYRVLLRQDPRTWS